MLLRNTDIITTTTTTTKTTRTIKNGHSHNNSNCLINKWDYTQNITQSLKHTQSPPTHIYRTSKGYDFKYMQYSFSTFHKTTHLCNTTDTSLILGNNPYSEISGKLTVNLIIIIIIIIIISSNFNNLIIILIIQFLISVAVKKKQHYD
jgi:hypothetical protein